jgi:hypothetical protein
VFGVLTGASKDTPVNMASIIGDGSSPDCHVCNGVEPSNQASTLATSWAAFSSRRSMGVNAML